MAEDATPANEPQYTTLDPAAVFYRPPTIDDLEAVCALEAASYPEDEAATPAKLRMRIEQCPELFLVAVASASDAIVGYACGTCTSASKLTHDSMSTHDPDGSLLCIHSVVVASELRRRGVATRLLQAYLRYVQACSPGLKEVRLISKEHVIKLYQGVGFTLLGPSDVQHGSEQWHELAYAFPSPGDAADA